MATRQIGPNLAPRKRAGAAGRVGATIFFLFWLVIPALFLVFIVRDAWNNGRTWLWDKADCTILESGVTEVGSDPDYALSVKYAYAAGPPSAVEAHTRVGTTYATGYRGDHDYAEAQRLALKYAPGTRTVCHVNPSNADEAVLERRAPWVLLILPFPLLFLTIGAGGLWFTWRRPSPGAKKATPISSGTAGRGAAWFLVLFFGAFFTVGVIVFVAVGGDLLKALGSGGWKQVPATVVSSNVRTHRGEDTSYSVNILYAYTVDGREYRSNRYNFMGGSSSRHAAKRAIVDRHPPGTRITAYVNPDDPTDAVIERGLKAEMLLLLVPLLFALVGAAGTFFTVRYIRRSGPASRTAPGGGGAGRATSPLTGRFVPVGRRPGHAPRGPLTLKPHHSPGLRLLAITLVALFWNGIVSIFLYQVVKGWSTGRGEFCLTIFLVPFVAVGAGLLVAVLYSLLALFNPRCTLTVSRGDLALGESVEFRWAFAGRYDRIHRLVLRVEGREEATYRRGTTTTTDRNVFCAQDVVDTSRATEFGSGVARWIVPADSMHSLTAGNNKVVWTLTVHGHIQGWPDVKEEFPLTVGPLRRAISTVSPDESEEQGGEDEDGGADEAADDATDTEAPWR